MSLKSGKLRSGLRNVSQAIGIPDSEADQKLVHRWVLDDVNGTVEDSVGDADGTNTGIQPISGAWAGGSAGDGDGVDDHIETTTLGDWGSGLNDDFAIAVSFTLRPVDSGTRRMLGSRNDNDTSGFRIVDGFSGDPGQINFTLYGQDFDDTTLYTANFFDDGEPYRLVINKTGNDASDIEIWTNQSQVSTTEVRSNFGGDATDLEFPFMIFNHNDGGSPDSVPWPDILDDVCLYDNSLTQSEIESYDNPWG